MVELLWLDLVVKCVIQISQVKCILSFKINTILNFLSENQSFYIHAQENIEYF